MKKLITIVLAAALAMGVSTAAFAADINVTVENKPVVWTDAKPFINSDNRTLVPLRPIAEAMGLKVQWWDNMATFSSTEGFAEFRINSKTYECGNMSGYKKVTMDTAAVISGGRTYAPARYLAEAFGYNVGWNAVTNTVTISKGAVENVAPKPVPGAAADNQKLDPLPPQNITAQPDWYMTLTAPDKMTNARLVAEYKNMDNYLRNNEKTDPTQVRFFDLQAELSKRVGALDRYAEYASAFGEADAADMKENADYKRAVASDMAPLAESLQPKTVKYFGL